MIELKDSGIDWIGEIPAHWEVKRFKSFAKAIKGKSIDALTEPVEGSHKVLSVECLRQDEAQFYDYVLADDEKQICTPKDIVVIWDGAGVGEFLKAKDGVLSSTIAKIQLTNKSVILPYLWYWRYKIEYRLKSIPTGMGIPHLNPTLLNNFMIAVPPIEEQKAIANYLDKKTEEIDTQINLLEQRQLAYTKLKRSLISKVITQGMNRAGELKDSGIDWIGEIPAHWEVKRFKSFAKAIKGKSIDALTEPVEGSHKVLSVECLRQDEAQFYDYVLADDEKQICTPKDIVVIWDGAGVGEFLKAKDGVLSSTIAKIQLTNKSVILPYLWYWRYKIEYRLKSIPTGMGIPHLNPTLLNNFMIAIPPIEEQRAIAEYLDKKTTEIDKNISLIEQKIAAYKRLKQSLIDEVVTGKRKIN